MLFFIKKPSVRFSETAALTSPDMLTSTLWLSLLLLLMATCLPISADEASNNDNCPPPWERYRGMCLIYSLKKANATGSRENCQKQGGDLVWMNNSTELENILAYARSKCPDDDCFVYIGLYRQYKSGPLIWTGGNTSGYCKIRRCNKVLTQDAGDLHFQIDTNDAPHIFSVDSIRWYPSIYRRL